MLVCAGLLILGGLLAALTISNAAVKVAPRPERASHCAVDGPPLHAAKA
jgi:hypothetical protein